jgi:hypothetical protein
LSGASVFFVIGAYLLNGLAQHLSVLERMSSEAAGIAQARRTAAFQMFTSQC